MLYAVAMNATAQIAALLGHAADAQKFSALTARAVVSSRAFNADPSICSNTQPLYTSLTGFVQADFKPRVWGQAFINAPADHRGSGGLWNGSSLSGHYIDVWSDRRQVSWLLEDQVEVRSPTRSFKFELGSSDLGWRDSISSSWNRECFTTLAWCRRSALARCWPHSTPPARRVTMACARRIPTSTRI